MMLYEDYLNSINIDENEYLNLKIGNTPLEDYLHGQCHVFALALHLEFGFPMVYSIDEYDLERECEVLIHAFCLHGHYAVDVRGYMHSDDILDDFDYNSPYNTEVSVEDLPIFLKREFIFQHSEEQLSEVCEFVKKNKFRYYQEH